jgi:hypothetical protein
MNRRALPLLILVMCAYWFYKGMGEYGLWFDGGPGGGFMPVLSSVFAAVFALFLLRSDRGERTTIPYSSFIPLVMVIFAVILSWLLGLLPALTVMLLIWLRRLERFPLFTSLLLTFLPMLVIYALFGLWLKVPFPTGMLGA